MRPIGWYVTVGGVCLVIGISVVMVSSVKEEKIGMPTTTNQVKAEEPEIPQTVSVNSGDGEVKVVEIMKKLNNDETNYQFKVVNIATGFESNLYEVILDSSRKISIPLNSWSPDNKQLFLQEEGRGQVNYLVFKSDGSAYKDGAQYLEINSYWNKTGKNLLIREITGWAGTDLLVVETTKTDGSNGPAYWFVTSSRSFMQLRQL